MAFGRRWPGCCQLEGITAGRPKSTAPTSPEASEEASRKGLTPLASVGYSKGHEGQQRGAASSEFEAQGRQGLPGVRQGTVRDRDGPAASEVQGAGQGPAAPEQACYEHRRKVTPYWWYLDGANPLTPLA